MASEESQSVRDDAGRNQTPKRLHLIIIGVIILILGLTTLVTSMWAEDDKEPAKGKTPEASVAETVPNFRSLEREIAVQQERAAKRKAQNEELERQLEEERRKRLDAEARAQSGDYDPRLNGQDINLTDTILRERGAAAASDAGAVAASPIIGLKSDSYPDRPIQSPDSPMGWTPPAAPMIQRDDPVEPSSGGDPMAAAIQQVNAMQQGGRDSHYEAFQEKAREQGPTGRLHIQPAMEGPTLFPGTVIPAALWTKIDTTLPGMVVAQVTRDIYDSKGSGTLMIPRGSRCIGLYDSKVFQGQNRILMAFQRLIFPDGRTIELGGMDAVDGDGSTGAVGSVNNHFWSMLGSSLLVASMAAGVESIGDDSVTVYNYGGSDPGQAGGKVILQTSEKVLDPYLNRRPVIKKEVGETFNIMVNKPIGF